MKCHCPSLTTSKLKWPSCNCFNHSVALALIIRNSIHLLQRLDRPCVQEWYRMMIRFWVGDNPSPRKPTSKELWQLKQAHEFVRWQMIANLCWTNSQQIVFRWPHALAPAGVKLRISVVAIGAKHCLLIAQAMFVGLAAIHLSQMECQGSSLPGKGLVKQSCT